MKRLFVALALAFLLLLSACPGGAGNSTPTGSPAGQKIRVISGTTLISTIVKEVGGSRVESVSIIPPAEDPAAFSVRFENITTLATADIFILHDWQKEKFSQSVIDSAKNPKLLVAEISLAGDWMIPDIQRQAADKVAATLKSLDASFSATYDAGLTMYKEKIRKKEDLLRQQIVAQKFGSDPASINVICAAPAADFVRWIGVTVVVTYGKPETMTPAKVQEIVDIVGQKKVAVIADTVQNGETAAEALAKKLGVERVVLSSYPSAAKYTTNWEDTIARNMTLLLATISNCPYC